MQMHPKDAEIRDGVRELLHTIVKHKGSPIYDDTGKKIIGIKPFTLKDLDVIVRYLKSLALGEEPPMPGSKDDLDAKRGRELRGVASE